MVWLRKINLNEAVLVTIRGAKVKEIARPA
jgi:hypothetical protein